MDRKPYGYPPVKVVELVKPAKTPFPAPLEEGLASDIYSKFLAQTPGEEEEEEEASKEPEGVLAEAPAEEQGAVDPLMGYTVEDVRLLLGQLTNELISSIQTEIYEKLQMQEDTYSMRIEKLKKA
ncbi:ciliary-associated calcium-binding coiled-coil protein 1-like [Pseudonaja textilis]|uniref:ciliary-associated calcium-binding coiled-coil protein 1-like n=1 Tax=Pseudonaja textilis TaxID=8673 RepID=UPI000EA9E8AC|nr:ciliary-associated calcium-binding coiled-coil protein 1-like [Pseudonaja textilis]XP_026579492.1 ciliary-associated calcium-binding coiled-coil protein 1-like [Pseudonaja textilis]